MGKRNDLDAVRGREHMNQGGSIVFEGIRGCWWCLVGGERVAVAVARIVVLLCP